MTRRIAIVTATLLCAAALAAAPAAGAVAAEPLASPHSAELRLAELRLAELRLAESEPSVQEAPPPDGSEMKSGSPEALAVQLVGAEVMSAEGSMVGEIEQIVEQPGEGRQAVVGVGGFLGIGETRVLLPADGLAPAAKGVVRSRLTEGQIRNLPIYRE